MAMGMKTFDRTLEDLGNMIQLENVNVRVPDQQLATQFYVVALGLTRDPYLMVGLENMWINAGNSQFHLPTAAAQVVRGFTGLVIPDFEELPAPPVVANEVRPPVRQTLSSHLNDEKARIAEALAACNWNRVRAAEMLGMPRRTFYRRLKQYQLQ